MVYRALVERDTATGRDPLGGPNVPAWTTLHTDLPCFLYTAKGREADTGTGQRVLETPMLLVPDGTDIQERDRVNQVKRRDGSVYRDGMWGVASVVEVHDHLEVRLESVSG